MVEYILGATILLLAGIIFIQLKVQSDLVNKLMSRDYSEYSRAKVLEEQVKKEIEIIKSQTNGIELERM